MTSSSHITVGYTLRDDHLKEFNLGGTHTLDTRQVEGMLTTMITAAMNNARYTIKLIAYDIDSTGQKFLDTMTKKVIERDQQAPLVIRVIPLPDLARVNSAKFQKAQPNPWTVFLTKECFQLFVIRSDVSFTNQDIQNSAYIKAFTPKYFALLKTSNTRDLSFEKDIEPNTLAIQSVHRALLELYPSLRQDIRQDTRQDVKMSSWKIFFLIVLVILVGGGAGLVIFMMIKKRRRSA